MPITMEMLKVVQRDRPDGPIPAGLKVTADSGPHSAVLAVGGFTLWPLSYLDNRESFGMVMYSPTGAATGQVEKVGARYIGRITLAGEGTRGTITFWGQADQKVVMNLSELEPLML